MYQRNKTFYWEISQKFVSKIQKEVPYMCLFKIIWSAIFSFQNLKKNNFAVGFAPIKGMCNRLRSCIVTQDTGLSTAFTIAHEIGHK